MENTDCDMDGTGGSARNKDNEELVYRKLRVGAFIRKIKGKSMIE